jgi:RNA polymerase sigma-70 factor (ECF subfamily)
VARTAARFDASGGLVLLEGQDRSLWDRAKISRATALLERACRARRVGPYQLQAAIAACHAEASRFEDTDWAQILFLYDLLLEVQPSPIVRLNRAVVLARVHGPSAGLAELASLSAVLDDYHLLHAIAGQLQSDLGHHAEARASQVRAAGLTTNAAEQALLSRRIQLLDAIC